MSWRPSQFWPEPSRLSDQTSTHSQWRSEIKGDSRSRCEEPRVDCSNISCESWKNLGLKSNRTLSLPCFSLCSKRNASPVFSSFKALPADWKVCWCTCLKIDKWMAWRDSWAYERETKHQNLAKPSFQIRTWFELLVQNMPHTQPIVAEAAVCPIFSTCNRVKMSARSNRSKFRMPNSTKLERDSSANP